MTPMDKDPTRGEALAVQLIGNDELRAQVKAVLAAVREPKLEVVDARRPDSADAAAPGDRNGRGVPTCRW
jgi:hypothetical protein